MHKRTLIIVAAAIASVAAVSVNAHVTLASAAK